MKPEDKHFRLQISFYRRWWQNWHIYRALGKLLCLGFDPLGGNRPLQPPPPVNKSATRIGQVRILQNKAKQKDSCEGGGLALYVEVHVYFDQ